MPILDFLAEPFAPEEDDPEFLDWYSNISKEANISSDPSAPRHYYDYKAAYEEGATLDEKKHLPSEFKHDLHPNRYIINKKDLSIHDSKYDVPAKFEDIVIQAFQRKEYEESIWKSN